MVNPLIKAAVKPTVIQRIAILMGDGRERTRADISLRVSADVSVVGRTVKHMQNLGLVSCEKSTDNKVLIYRMKAVEGT